MERCAVCFETMTGSSHRCITCLSGLRQPNYEFLRCPECHRSVHPFCGKKCGEEGQGQSVWCSRSGICLLAENNYSELDCDISIESLSDGPSSNNIAPFERVPEDACAARKSSSEITQDMRQSIWQRYLANPKMKQIELRDWARNEFGLSSLSQSAISRILSQFRSEAAKTGNLTNEQVKKIFEHYRKKPNVSQKYLQQWAKAEFNLSRTPSQSTISNIVNKKRCAVEVSQKDLKLKRKRVIKSEALDTALVEWILRCQQSRVALSWQIIQKKAEHFADLLQLPASQRVNFSDGWMEKFLSRNELRSIKMNGESGSADHEAIEKALPMLKATIARYKPCDVFNMDETGLFYCMAPDRTIASRQLEGMKKNKTRISIALCANADGSEKLEPFFIGHYLKPRAFNKKSGAELGFSLPSQHQGLDDWSTFSRVAADVGQKNESKRS